MSRDLDVGSSKDARGPSPGVQIHDRRERGLPARAMQEAPPRDGGHSAGPASKTTFAIRAFNEVGLEHRLQTFLSSQKEAEEARRPSILDQKGPEPAAADALTAMGEKWLPFAAQAFTEAAIRRQQAEQFGDPFQSEAEKRRLSELKRPEPLTMKQGASGMRYLSHEETTALQNKERNLTHSREFLRRGWTQQSFCRVVRGMDFAYNARQAKSIRRAGDRDEGEVLGADSKSASRAKELEEKLRKSTFFKDMERQKKGIIHKLAKVSKVRGENAGQVVFRQGDQAASVYLIVSGSVAVLARPEKARAPETPRPKPAVLKDMPTLTAIREAQKPEEAPEEVVKVGVNTRPGARTTWLIPDAPARPASASAPAGAGLWTRVNSRERAAASWKVKMNFAAPEKAEVKRLEPREDEAGRPVYATVEGFNCFREDSDLGPQVNVLESGAVFGEVSLLSDAPRSASVRCLEDCELLVVNAVAFRKVLAEFVDVARACGALQSVDFFNKLEETTPGIIHTLAKSSEFLTELKGQVIFRQNDPGKCCFILVKGQVTVHMREGRKGPPTPRMRGGEMPTLTDWRRTGLEAFDETARSEEKRNGKQPRPAQSFRTSEGFSTFSKESNYGKMLRFLREVSLFGELALQNTEPRSASIVCSQDSEFLRLRKEDFLAAIQGRKQKIYFFDEHIEALKDFADKKAQGALLQHPSLLFTDEIYRDGQPITTEGVYANTKVYLVGAGAKVDLFRYKEPCASPAYFLARRPRSAPKKSKGPCLRMLPDNLEPCPAEEALQQSAGIFNPNEEDMDLYGTLQEGSLFGTAGALQNHSPEPFSAVARCETETCTIYALDSAGMQQLHPKLLAVLREMVAEGSLERLQQLPAPPNAWQAEIKTPKWKKKASPLLDGEGTPTSQSWRR
ncbi:unnamed protein product [Effrenium voratum]|nr:unnamed protein product [Effrenium voratum]